MIRNRRTKVQTRAHNFVFLHVPKNVNVETCLGNLAAGGNEGFHVPIYLGTYVIRSRCQQLDIWFLLLPSNRAANFNLTPFSSL